MLSIQPPIPRPRPPCGTSAILQKIKDPATRLWYAAKALENGWPRSIFTLQIESAAHQFRRDRARLGGPASPRSMD